MLVRCPDCGLMFRVGMSQLPGGNGLVRCKACAALLQIGAHGLSVTRAASPVVVSFGVRAAESTAFAQSPEFPLSAMPVELAVSPRAIASAPVENPRAEARPVAGNAAVPAAMSVPGRRENQANWRLGAYVLLLLLLGQVLWRHGARCLVQFPPLFRAVEAAAALFGAQPPSIHLPTMIGLQSPAMVGSHPTVGDAMIVKLTMVNGAHVRQAFPRIELSLFDHARRPVARRVFHPNEYMGAHLDKRQGLLPTVPVLVQMELLAPSVSPERYEFRFL